MTEDEAKTKWCPMAIRPGFQQARNGIGGASFNRTREGQFTDSTHCIASDCMMWRWDSGMANRSETMRDSGEAEGRCGLAK